MVTPSLNDLLSGAAEKPTRRSRPGAYPASAWATCWTKPLRGRKPHSFHV